MEKCHVFDEIKHADVNQDTLQQTWTVAFIFLLFFLFSAMFSVTVIIIKVRIRIYLTVSTVALISMSNQMQLII